MRALLQRVSEASVSVDGQCIGAIGSGLLVFLAVEKGDTPAMSERLAERCLRYRVFADENGKMNRSLLDVGGELLLVSQFTLAADTASGLRPSFTPAAGPEVARSLYERFRDAVNARGVSVQTGRFGADMQVALVNDGPVTFWLSMLE